MLDQRVGHRQAGEGLVQVHRASGVAQRGRAGGLARGVAQHLLGEVHQVVMVPVGRVELHHRELRVVPDADAFVAEVAVDLEHALEAAHHQALEIKLGRDAQEHLLVQRVVVGDKGLGVGAAGNRVEHGRFHLQEAVLHHELPDRAHRLAARHEAGAGVLVGHQIHVTLAVLLLLVGHAVELVRQRAQALGEQAHARGLDRQFPRLGAKQRALARQDVAQVPMLEGGQRFGTHRVLRDVDLQPARAVLQRAEAGLAHHALEHHAPGNGHGKALRLQRLVGDLPVAVVQVAGVVGGLEVVGEGRRARGLGLGPQRGQFLAPLGDQLVVIGVNGGRGGAHEGAVGEGGQGQGF